MEVYCGKKQHASDEHSTVDDRAGPSAVLRNLSAIMPKQKQDWHLVVLDRYYTSLALVLELWKRQIYCVGTVQTRRLGFPKALVDTRKTRPKTVKRGEFQVAVLKENCVVTATKWWDNKAVYMLSSGASKRVVEVGTWTVYTYRYLFVWA